ncbi:methylglutaconyl-CoA hydratase [Lewinella marina]|uniref:Enoyl-CoA hydratase n=1 Tax=Neolewinella marina TaxID=438751 RepID=A0A2G0CD20_9BACT|nr:enoyl-CoA hydratase/isomerase family protein [Neolewinella marina]NJB86930.1 methylglutaconyl-CoA hydratase [Neolewinella marina]PHK97873.1 enoyl-CoA hydratase [Neolewinella marina]
MNQAGSITSELRTNWMRIVFSHPSHNSMPSSLLAELVEHIEAAASNEAVKSIMIRSAGDDTFCAGANLDELLAIQDEESGRKFFMGFANVILAMRRCPKPIVVAVQGKAIGGGVGIAAAADYCLGCRASEVKLSELAIAIGPFVILPALIRKMGVAAASELCLDTEWHDAKWGREKGLYQRVYAGPEELFREARLVARKLASYSPGAAERLKRSLWEGTEDWPQLLAERAGITGQLVLQPDAKAALAKFKKK